MKRLIALTILILTTIFVKGQVELPIDKTALENGYRVKEFRQTPDTINVDLNHFAKSDTVIISGLLADGNIGENHLEQIYISRQGRNLFCWLIIYPNEGDLVPREENVKIKGFGIKKDPYKETVKLGKREKELIKDFFHKLCTFEAQMSESSNSLTGYTVEKNRKQLYIRTQDKDDWKGFIELRDNLFLH